MKKLLQVRIDQINVILKHDRKRQDPYNMEVIHLLLMEIRCISNYQADFFALKRSLKQCI